MRVNRSCVEGVSRRSLQGGFSLLEVLIALVILAVGLLGLGLLQTMNLRYTKSAEQRTIAVNLASELLDTIRSNRSQVDAYAIAAGEFGDVTVPANGCAMDEALTPASNLARWRCQVRESLGPQASAVVTVAAPEVSVTVSWDESRLAGEDDEDTDGSITLESRI